MPNTEGTNVYLTQCRNGSGSLHPCKNRTPVTMPKLMRHRVIQVSYIWLVLILACSTFLEVIYTEENLLNRVQPLPTSLLLTFHAPFPKHAAFLSPVHTHLAIFLENTPAPQRDNFNENVRTKCIQIV